MAIKLDMERIRCDFLEYALASFEFHERWIRRVLSCKQSSLCHPDRWNADWVFCHFSWAILGLPSNIIFVYYMCGCFFLGSSWGYLESEVTCISFYTRGPGHITFTICGWLFLASSGDQLECDSFEDNLGVLLCSIGLEGEYLEVYSMLQP